MDGSGEIKHPGGRPRIATVLVTARWREDKLADLDDWIDRRPGKRISRAEAIRLLAEDALPMAVPERHCRRA
jgi:hypothetical protein